MNSFNINSDPVQKQYIQHLEQQIAVQSLSDEVRIVAFAISDVFTRVINNIINFFLTTFCPSFGLRLAAFYDNHQRFEIMLAAGADINSESFFTGLTAMHYAAEQGHSVMIRTLKDHGAAIDPANEDGYTPLHIAIENDQINAMATLIHLGANVQNRVTTYSEDGEPASKLTALHLAAQTGKAYAVDVLLLNGSNIHELTSDNRTALHLAIEHGHTQLAKNLIAAQMPMQYISVNQRDDLGMSALHVAAKIGNTEVILPLLGAGANIDTTDEKGNTPLHTALQNGHLEVVRMLIARGANINIPNLHGITPLHKAIIECPLRTLHDGPYLFEDHSETIAQFDQYRAIILDLIEKGADLHTQSIRGMTAHGYLCDRFSRLYGGCSEEFYNLLSKRDPNLFKNYQERRISSNDYRANLIKITLDELRERIEKISY